MATATATDAKPKRARKAEPAPPQVVRLTLTIAGVAYAVRRLRPADLPPGFSVGWRLTRTDPRFGRVSHHVVAGPSGSACSCQSAMYRTTLLWGPCKHRRAMIAVGLI